MCVYCPYKGSCINAESKPPCYVPKPCIVPIWQPWYTTPYIPYPGYTTSDPILPNMDDNTKFWITS